MFFTLFYCRWQHGQRKGTASSRANSDAPFGGDSVSSITLFCILYEM